MSNRTLVVSVLADTKKFSDGLTEATKVAGVAVAAIGAAVGAFIVTSVKAAAEAEKVAAQTAAVLASTGQAAGRTADQISDIASELSFLSGVDDEVVQAGANILLTFTKIQGANFDKATAAALDLSVALGTDLNSASVLVGKALNDPIKGISALGRSGVQFTEDQKAVIASLVETGDVAGAQAIILAELNTQFGGSAAAFGATLEGSIGRVKTLLGNIQEAIGGAFLPALTTATNQVATFLNTLTSAPAFSAFIDNLGKFANDLLSGQLSLASITGALQSGIQSAADWLANGGVQTIVDSFIAGREAFFAAALKVFPVIVDALVSVVPEIITGVVALVSSLIAVLVQSAPVLLAGAVQLLLGLVQGVVAILPTLLAAVVGLVPVLVDAIVAAVPQLLEGAILLFTALLDAVIQIVPPLLQQIIAILPGILEALISLIPQLIDGAIGLFMALVEAWPQIVPPLLEAVIALIPIIITALVDLIPALIDGAVSLFTAIVEAVPVIIPMLITAIVGLIPKVIGALINAIPKLFEGAFRLFSAVPDAVGKIIPALLEAGGQLVQGFFDGVAAGWKVFIKWWNDTVGGVIDVVKDLFGIRSPSKVFDQIGVDLIRGLERGLSRSNNVTALMSDLTSQVEAGFDPQLSISPATVQAGRASVSSASVEDLAEAFVTKMRGAAPATLKLDRESMVELVDLMFTRGRLDSRMGTA